MKKMIVLLLFIAYAPALFAQNASEKIFYNTLIKARKEGWVRLPTQGLMARIAYSWLGTPYVAHTLEGDGPEEIRVVLDGLDCFTLVEQSLDMSRVIKKHGFTFDKLESEVQQTRYRNGEIDGYLSRLHYTSEWLYHNINQGVLEDVTPALGGIEFNPDVRFMSAHPQYYQKLKADSTLIPPLRKIEDSINKRTFYYIPKDKIPEIEKYLQTGDIVMFTTSVAGLDYGHLGLVWRDGNDVPRLLHASSSEKQVHLDKGISEYIDDIKIFTGITVARPLDQSIK
ncbi:MAG: N-acetylmuramoyl-L-alanine amidase-like domain-containing protein [Candidatus Kapaibacterium sp.]